MVDQDQEWVDTQETWGSAAAIFGKTRPIQIIGDDFYAVDEGEDFQGSPVVATISREGLTIFARDQEGNPKSDPMIIKSVQAIWPEIEGNAGDVIQVSVGFQDELNSEVSWQGPRDFVIGTDFFLDFVVTGRYLAVRFESLGMAPWTLTGYDLEIEIVGVR